MSDHERIKELEEQVKILAGGLGKIALLSSGRSESRWAEEALAEAKITGWFPNPEVDQQ